MPLDLMPVDPVCGIELEERFAVMYKHRETIYHFCCEGCKRIFIRKPKKYA
jgi:YHS domain-containing protein